eukprot:2265386-Rhodomonas_salina.5
MPSTSIGFSAALSDLRYCPTALLLPYRFLPYCFATRRPVLPYRLAQPCAVPGGGESGAEQGYAEGSAAGAGQVQAPPPSPRQAPHPPGLVAQRPHPGHLTPSAARARLASREVLSLRSARPGSASSNLKGPPATDIADGARAGSPQGMGVKLLRAGARAVNRIAAGAALPLPALVLSESDGT